MSEAYLIPECPPLPCADGVEYRHIPGWPGYAAGADGTIWSCKIRSTGPGPWGSWRRLSPCVSNSGYLHLNLMHRQKGFKRTVHRLILETFVEPRATGMECRHLDGNKKNNALENLRWGTRSENAHDYTAHGRYRPGLAENHPWAKLSDAEVLEIRRLAAKPEITYVKIAAQFGISTSYVGQLYRRKSRTNI